MTGVLNALYVKKSSPLLGRVEFQPEIMIFDRGGLSDLHRTLLICVYVHTRRMTVHTTGMLFAADRDENTRDSSILSHATDGQYKTAKANGSRRSSVIYIYI